MQIIEFDEEPVGNMVPGVPVANAQIIGQNTFDEFEPVVSLKILAWISRRKSFNVPLGMKVVAVVSTANPRVRSGPWHYGEGVYAPINGTKRVLHSNLFAIWLCDDKKLVLRLANVFHFEIAALPDWNKDSFAEQSVVLNGSINERVMRALAIESQKISHESSELKRHQDELEKRRDTVNRVATAGIKISP